MPEPSTLEHLIGIFEATIGLYMTSIVIMGIHLLVGKIVGSDDYARLEDGTIPGMIEFANDNRPGGGLNFIVELGGGITGIFGGVLIYLISGFAGITYEVLISILLEQSVSFYPGLYLSAAFGLVTALYLQDLVVETLTWQTPEF